MCEVTFSDVKMPTGSPSQPFMVDLLSKSEYYPYGMKINELSYNNGILDSIGLSGGNHGWPFYPSFVKPLVKKNVSNYEKNN